MLLDTSGLLCLHHQAEPFHQVACRAYQAAHVRLTHGYVLAEFVALAQARRLPRLAALALVADLVANPDIETVWGDEALHHKAMALLQARPDKAYSLCDAVSFVLIRQRKVNEALTTDHHFEQKASASYWDRTRERRLRRRSQPEPSYWYPGGQRHRRRV